MENYSQQEFELIINQFNDRTLPKQKWTHEAHLLVAFYHISIFEFAQALGLVKTKIKEYNTAIGTPNTENSGYHETLTIFWMIVCHNFLIKQNKNDSIENLSKFIRLHSNTNLVFDFYDRELLLSTAARKKWINGNLKPIELLRTDQISHYNLSNTEFKRQFETYKLDPALFSHEAHLRLAWIVVKENGIESAIKIISDQILKFVSNLNAEDKYNMTVTVAAVKAVGHFINKSNAKTFPDFILEFPRLKNNFKELMAAHYSFDIYNSKTAKDKYLEPDLLGF